ncbi:Xpo1 [Symbiodinium natans]|uniref:Xpo1 protein n=1 Tax=Symbiodinium natans TaxID=878477 RepID=A0A812GV92_9DINO|nr:Xpo1 [Symbiodinium natans]
MDLPRNRAYVLLREQTDPGRLYGFQVSVRPSSLVAGEWYVWTQTERSPRLLEGSRASFNPDHNQEPWQLSAEELQVNISLSDRRPFLLTAATSAVEIRFVSPRSGRTSLRVVAPSGYVWGPPVAAALSRSCWAAAVPGWPCVANVVTWHAVDLSYLESYPLHLEVQLPSRMPNLGSNAFFVELGALSSSPEDRWAGAAVSNDQTGEPFLILAISEVSVACDSVLQK